MTSTGGAGFPSTALGKRQFDPLNQGGRGATPQLAKPAEVSAEAQYKVLEREVNRQLELSSEAKLKGKVSEALDYAKEAGSKERSLRKNRENAGMVDQINIDLTYAVFFNLANIYEANGMHQDALNTYAMIVRNKQYPQAGRLRVNMGNIYYAQKKYSTAIKMYRMALDLVQTTGKHTKFQILNNIGNSFVQLGQYHDAVDSFENIMQGEPDFQAAFNLIVCYFALEDKEKMKKGFTQLLSIEIPGLEDDEDAEPNADFANDAINVYLKEKRSRAYKYITDAAKLIAPVIESDWTRGYDWVIETLRSSNFSVVESELGIHKAVQYMKQRNFDQAIEVFKSFEKKDKAMMARVATNISFLYFIEKDLKNAEKYADIAIKNDRYNAKALVNKGNCLFIREEYEAAKNYFLEAIGVEADCVEAIYNLGLVNRRLEETRADAGYETLQAFEKLQNIMNNAPEVLFQIGSIYERAEDYQQAIKWYNVLVTRLPSDAGVLQRIARMHSLLQEENQAFHYYSESYRHFPVSIETIQWLGAFYVKSELYEKAWTFFERAAQIQPQEVKWKLMVASCFRRMGSYQRALKVFEDIHEAHPENVDCLQYLVSLCKEMNLKYDHYNIALKKLLREKEMETPFIEPPPPPPQAPQVESRGDVQVRPGTSRTGGRKMSKKQQEEGDWANEDIELP